MSRKQAPRAAGKRPAASADSERREVVSFTNMSKERAV